MDPSIIDCADQLILRPSITSVDNRPILSKTVAVSTTQKMAPVIELVLRDGEGRPINFESCGFSSLSSSSSASANLGGSVQFRGREILDVSNGAFLVDAEGAFVNAAAGVVRVKIPATATEAHGLIDITCGVFNASGEMIHNTSFYLLVERSQFGSVTANAGVPAGLPPVSQIRIHLRDSAPEDNPLLNTLEFDLSEICESMLHCVEHWNTMQPKVRRTYNTTNFLNPTVMIDGIMGELYLLAAKHYRRNQLAYSAGGLSVDDKNKAQEYEVIGERMLQEYLKWVRMTKIQINKEAWDGSFGSTYDGFGRYR
jgi:hypothetical protein